MQAYKLFKIKEGKIYPLFIDNKWARPFGEWLTAEFHPKKSFAPRLGYHCCFVPFAPHLKTELSNGEKRVWVKCEVEDWKSYDRPESQGGAWVLAQKIKLIRILTNEEVEQILLTVKKGA